MDMLLPEKHRFAAHLLSAAFACPLATPAAFGTFYNQEGRARTRDGGSGMRPVPGGRSVSSSLLLGGELVVTKSRRPLGLECLESRRLIHAEHNLQPKTLGRWLYRVQCQLDWDGADAVSAHTGAKRFRRRSGDFSTKCGEIQCFTAFPAFLTVVFGQRRTTWKGFCPKTSPDPFRNIRYLFLCQS